MGQILQEKEKRSKRFARFYDPLVNVLKKSSDQDDKQNLINDLYSNCEDIQHAKYAVLDGMKLTPNVVNHNGDPEDVDNYQVKILYLGSQ